MNIVDVIKKETIEYLQKPSVIDGAYQVSYGELLSNVDIVADRLKKFGIKPGQRVGLLCNDSIEYVVINLAVLSINAVIVPIFPSLSVDEVKSILERIKVNFLISEKAINVEGSSDNILLNSTVEKNFFLYSCSTDENIASEFYAFNPAFIRFSSGTTGVNKGVVLSHESIIQRTDAANKGLKIDSSDVVIWVLSMTFHFVVTILLFLRRAATIVLCGREFPELLLESLKRQKATFLYASPFHYYMLSHEDSFSPDLLSNVRIAISTATKLSKDITDSFYQKFSFALSQAYGIIEVGLPFLNCSEDKTKHDSVGKILPDYEMKLEDIDSEGVGKVYLRGKGMFDAYFSPWQSRQQLLDNGWFCTGDMGRIDKEGFLFLAGRIDNIINFCGMKIFPYEVESVINQYPDVKESLVFGVPHTQYGHLPTAKIVLNNDAKNNFDKGKLRKFCYQHLAPHKVPKSFYCVSSLEKTQSGKIKRH